MGTRQMLKFSNSQWTKHVAGCIKTVGLNCFTVWNLISKSCQTQWSGGPVWWENRACLANVHICFHWIVCRVEGWNHSSRMELVDASSRALSTENQKLIWRRGEAWVVIHIYTDSCSNDENLSEQGFIKPRLLPATLPFCYVHRGLGIGFLADVNQSSSSGAVCWLIWAGGPALRWESGSYYDACVCV